MIYGVPPRGGNDVVNARQEIGKRARRIISEAFFIRDQRTSRCSDSGLKRLVGRRQVVRTLVWADDDDTELEKPGSSVKSFRSSKPLFEY